MVVVVLLDKGDRVLNVLGRRLAVEEERAVRLELRHRAGVEVTVCEKLEDRALACEEMQQQQQGQRGCGSPRCGRDVPAPEGPIMAETSPAGNDAVTLRRIVFVCVLVEKGQSPRLVHLSETWSIWRG